MKQILAIYLLLITPKILAQPTIQWQKAFGGSSSDEARAVRQTNDGGFIVAGSTSSADGEITANHGSLDFWIIKLDTFGNIQWQKTYGGSVDEQLFSIIQTTDGGYVAIGYTRSSDKDVSGNHGETRHVGIESQ